MKSTTIAVDLAKSVRARLEGVEQKTTQLH